MLAYIVLMGAIMNSIQCIHIALLSRDSTIPGAKALIRSIFLTSSSRPEDLTIHVFEILPQTADFTLLESWVEARGGTMLRYGLLPSDDFECDGLIEQEDSIALFLEKHLPSIDEIVYMSTDMIVTKCIDAFMNANSMIRSENAHVLGAISVPSGTQVNETIYSRLKFHGIINVTYAGFTPKSLSTRLLIINLKAWRSNRISSIVHGVCNVNKHEQLWEYRYSASYLLEVIFNHWGHELADSAVKRSARIKARYCHRGFSADSTFLQWDAGNRPWLSTAENCRSYWDEFSEGPNAKYLFKFASALFLGFTAPRPENNSEYFNRGSGNDWIARLPQFVATFSNATVYVCESGRIINEKLGKYDSSVHKLIPYSLRNSKCGSISVPESDARLIQFDLVIVRQTAEIGLMRRIWGEAPPKLTAIFPLQYKIGKKNSNCRFLGDVCIPDNHLFKGFTHEIVQKCTPLELNHRHDYFERKYILFPAKIHPRKGQLEFIESVHAQLLKIFTIMFIGPLESDPAYAEEVKGLCEDKELFCEFPGRLPQNEIFELIRAGNVFGVVSFGISDADPNPRIVGESLSCGLPVLIGPMTLVPDVVESHFPSIGSRVHNLSEASAVFSDWIRQNFSVSPSLFYRDHGSEKTTYEYLFKNVFDNPSWRTGWGRSYPKE